jgi:hypothetical protein
MAMIRDLITENGGPKAFRRALRAFGVDVPAPTVQAWSAAGAAHREPPAWVTAALTVLLSGHNTRITETGKG